MERLRLSEAANVERNLLIPSNERRTCADRWAGGSSLALLCRKQRVGSNQNVAVVGAPPTRRAPPGALRCDYRSLWQCVCRRWEGHRSLWCSHVGGALKTHRKLWAACTPVLKSFRRNIYTSSTPGSQQSVISAPYRGTLPVLQLVIIAA